MTNYPETEQVCFLKANINYTEIVLVDGNTILSSKTLKKVLCEYYKNFLRVNRGIAINPTMIQEKKGNQVKINNQMFTISRRRL